MTSKRYQFGITQITLLLGLLLVAITIPVSITLVSQNQENRSDAAKGEKSAYDIKKEKEEAAKSAKKAKDAADKAAENPDNQAALKKAEEAARIAKEDQDKVNQSIAIATIAKTTIVQIVSLHDEDCKIAGANNSGVRDDSCYASAGVCICGGREVAGTIAPVSKSTLAPVFIPESSKPTSSKTDEIPISENTDPDYFDSDLKCSTAHPNEKYCYASAGGCICGEIGSAVKFVYGWNSKQQKITDDLQNGDKSGLIEVCKQKQGSGCDSLSIESLISTYAPYFSKDASVLAQKYNEIALQVSVANDVSSGNKDSLVALCKQKQSSGCDSMSIENLTKTFLPNFDSNKIITSFNNINNQKPVVEALFSGDKSKLIDLCLKSGSSNTDCNNSSLASLINKYLPQYSGQTSQIVSNYEKLISQNQVALEFLNSSDEELRKKYCPSVASNEYCVKTLADIKSGLDLKNVGIGDSQIKALVSQKNAVEYQNKVVSEYLSKTNEQLVKEKCVGMSPDNCQKLISGGALLKNAGVSEEKVKQIIAQKISTEFINKYINDQLVPEAQVSYQAEYDKALKNCVDIPQRCKLAADVIANKVIADANNKTKEQKSKIEAEYLSLNLPTPSITNYNTEYQKAKDACKGSYSCLQKIDVVANSAVNSSKLLAQKTMIETVSLINQCKNIGGKNCSTKDSSLETIAKLTGNNTLTPKYIETTKNEVLAQISSKNKISSTLENLGILSGVEKQIDSGAVSWTDVEKNINEQKKNLANNIVITWNDVTAGRFKRGNDTLGSVTNEKNIYKVGDASFDLTPLYITPIGRIMGIEAPKDTGTYINGMLAQGGDAAMVAVGLVAAPIFAPSAAAYFGTGLGVAGAVQSWGMMGDVCQQAKMGKIPQSECESSRNMAVIMSSGVVFGAVNDASRAVTAGKEVSTLTRFVGTATKGSKASLGVKAAEAAIDGLSVKTFSDMANKTCDSPESTELDCASSRAMALASIGKFVGNVGGIVGQSLELNKINSLAQAGLTYEKASTTVHLASAGLFFGSACSKLADTNNLDTVSMCVYGASGLAQSTAGYRDVINKTLILPPEANKPVANNTKEETKIITTEQSEKLATVEKTAASLKIAETKLKGWEDALNKVINDKRSPEIIAEGSAKLEAAKQAVKSAKNANDTAQNELKIALEKPINPVVETTKNPIVPIEAPKKGLSAILDSINNILKPKNQVQKTVQTIEVAPEISTKLVEVVQNDVNNQFKQKIINDKTVTKSVVDNAESLLKTVKNNKNSTALEIIKAENEFYRLEKQLRVEELSQKIPSIKDATEYIPKTGNEQVDVLVENIIRRTESRQNADWIAQKKDSLFSVKKEQVVDAVKTFADSKNMIVSKTAAGKTTTISPIAMQMANELLGLKGVFIAKDGQSLEAYNAQKIILGDDLYRFVLNEKDALGRPISLENQVKNLEKAKYLDLEMGDLAFLIDKSRNPQSTIKDLLLARRALKAIVSKSSILIDELPELLGSKTEWIEGVGGRVQVKATPNQTEIITKLGNILKSKNIGILTDGFIGSTSRLNQNDIIKQITAPDGTVIKDAKFSRNGVEKVYGELVKSKEFGEGVSLNKVMEVVDALSGKGSLPNDPSLVQKVREWNDALNKTSRMITSDFGSDSFYIDGSAKSGKGGNVQLNQQDNEIMTALARELISSHVFGQKPNYSNKSVNGQTIKTNIFDVISTIDQLSGGKSRVSGMTATPEDIRLVAEAAGFKFGVTDPKSSEAIFGVNGRLSKNNIIGGGNNIESGINKWLEMKSAGELNQGNIKDNHILAINGVITKEAASKILLDKLEPGTKLAVAAEDGKVYWATKNQEKITFTDATNEFININLSTGKFNKTVVLILEGKSVGGNFPANKDASFMSVGDIHTLTLEKTEQLMGRGVRTGEILIKDGFIVTGEGFEAINNRESLVQKLTNNSVEFKKSLNTDLLTALADSSYRSVISKEINNLWSKYESGDVSVEKRLKQGLDMLATLDASNSKLETNVVGSAPVAEINSRQESVDALSSKFKEFITKYPEFVNNLSPAAKAEFISNSEKINLAYTSGSGSIGNFDSSVTGAKAYEAFHNSNVKAEDLIAFKSGGSNNDKQIISQNTQQSTSGILTWIKTLFTPKLVVIDQAPVAETISPSSEIISAKNLAAYKNIKIDSVPESEIVRFVNSVITARENAINNNVRSVVVNSLSDVDEINRLTAEQIKNNQEADKILAKINAQKQAELKQSKLDADAKTKADEESRIKAEKDAIALAEKQKIAAERQSLLDAQKAETARLAQEKADAKKLADEKALAEKQKIANDLQQAKSEALKLGVDQTKLDSAKTIAGVNYLVELKKASDKKLAQAEEDSRLAKEESDRLAAINAEKEAITKANELALAKKAQDKAEVANAIETQRAQQLNIGNQITNFYNSAVNNLDLARQVAQRLGVSKIGEWPKELNRLVEEKNKPNLNLISITRNTTDVEKASISKWFKSNEFKTKLQNGINVLTTKDNNGKYRISEDYMSFLFDNYLMMGKPLLLNQDKINKFIAQSIEIFSKNLPEKYFEVDNQKWFFFEGLAATGSVEKFQFAFSQDSAGGYQLRTFWKSSSGGNWRSTTMFEGGHIDKGNDISYVQETQLDSSLEQFLINNSKSEKQYFWTKDSMKLFFNNTVLQKELGWYDYNPVEYVPEKGVGEASLLNTINKYLPGSLNKENNIDLIKPENFRDLNIPDSFIPSFTDEPVLSYSDTHDKLGEITIEIYRHKWNKNTYNWEICHDKEGRIWIKNISINNSKITSYGNYSVIFPAGILVSKPIDYSENIDAIDLGFPLQKIDAYYDITPLLDNLKPIRIYRQVKNIKRVGSAVLPNNEADEITRLAQEKAALAAKNAVELPITNTNTDQKQMTLDQQLIQEQKIKNQQELIVQYNAKIKADAEEKARLNKILTDNQSQKLEIVHVPSEPFVQVQNNKEELVKEIFKENDFPVVLVSKPSAQEIETKEKADAITTINNALENRNKNMAQLNAILEVNLTNQVEENARLAKLESDRIVNINNKSSKVQDLSQAKSELEQQLAVLIQNTQVQKTLIINTILKSVTSVEQIPKILNLVKNKLIFLQYIKPRDFTNIIIETTKVSIDNSLSEDQTNYISALLYDYIHQLSFSLKDPAINFGIFDNDIRNDNFKNQLTKNKSDFVNLFINNLVIDLQETPSFQNEKNITPIAQEVLGYLYDEYRRILNIINTNNFSSTKSPSDIDLVEQFTIVESGPLVYEQTRNNKEKLKNKYLGPNDFPIVLINKTPSAKELEAQQKSEAVDELLSTVQDIAIQNKLGLSPDPDIPNIVPQTPTTNSNSQFQEQINSLTNLNIPEIQAVINEIINEMNGNNVTDTASIYNRIDTITEKITDISDEINKQIGTVENISGSQNLVTNLKALQNQLTEVNESVAGKRESLMTNLGSELLQIRNNLTNKIEDSSGSIDPNWLELVDKMSNGAGYLEGLNPEGLLQLEYVIAQGQEMNSLGPIQENIASLNALKHTDLALISTELKRYVDLLNEFDSGKGEKYYGTPIDTSADENLVIKNNVIKSILEVDTSLEATELEKLDVEALNKLNNKLIVKFDEIKKLAKRLDIIVSNLDNIPTLEKKIVDIRETIDKKKKSFAIAGLEIEYEQDIPEKVINRKGSIAILQKKMIGLKKEVETINITNNDLSDIASDELTKLADNFKRLKNINTDIERLNNAKLQIAAYNALIDNISKWQKDRQNTEYSTDFARSIKSLISNRDDLDKKLKGTTVSYSENDASDTLGILKKLENQVDAYQQFANSKNLEVENGQNEIKNLQKIVQYLIDSLPQVDYEVLGEKLNSQEQKNNTNSQPDTTGLDKSQSKQTQQQTNLFVQIRSILRTPNINTQLIREIFNITGVQNIAHWSEIYNQMSDLESFSDFSQFNLQSPTLESEIKKYFDGQISKEITDTNQREQLVNYLFNKLKPKIDEQKIQTIKKSAIEKELKDFGAVTTSNLPQARDLLSKAKSVNANFSSFSQAIIKAEELRDSILKKTSDLNKKATELGTSRNKNESDEELATRLEKIQKEYNINPRINQNEKYIEYQRRINTKIEKERILSISKNTNYYKNASDVFAIARQIFGVDQFYTSEEVRQKYKKLVSLFHPDVNQDPEAKNIFLLIGDAYKLLTSKTIDEWNFTPSDASNILEKYFTNSDNVTNNNENNNIAYVWPKEIIVGSGQMANILFDDTTISRKHFSFGQDKYGMYIIDHNSTNGTYLNDKKIESNKKVSIKLGDVIKIGHLGAEIFYVRQTGLHVEFYAQKSKLVILVNSQTGNYKAITPEQYHRGDDTCSPGYTGCSARTTTIKTALTQALEKAKNGDISGANIQLDTIQNYTNSHDYQNDPEQSYQNALIDATRAEIKKTAAEQSNALRSIALAQEEINNKKEMIDSPEIKSQELTDKQETINKLEVKPLSLLEQFQITLRNAYYNLRKSTESLAKTKRKEEDKNIETNTKTQEVLDVNAQIQNQPPDQIIDSKVTQDENPTFTTVDKVTIVGEQHIKNKIDKKSEQIFTQDLNLADMIILEFDSIAPNYWSQVSSQKRFMQVAQEYAVNKNKPLVILDSEITDRYKLWLDTGINISREDFLILAGINLMNNDFSNNVSVNESVQKLTKIYTNNFPNYPEYANKLANIVYNILFSPNEINNYKEKTDLIIDFLGLDAMAREIYYQTRIKNIKESNLDKDILVVVGKSHSSPVTNTLDDGLITKVNTQLQDKINNTLTDIKKRINFEKLMNDTPLTFTNPLEFSNTEMEIYSNGMEIVKKISQNQNNSEILGLLSSPDVVSNIVGIQPLKIYDFFEAALIIQSFEENNIKFSEEYSVFRSLDNRILILNNKAAEQILKSNQRNLGIEILQDTLTKDEISNLVQELMSNKNITKANIVFGLLSGFPYEDCLLWSDGRKGKVPELLKTYVFEKNLPKSILVTFIKLESYTSSITKQYLSLTVDNAYLPKYKDGFVNLLGVRWVTSIPPSISSASLVNKLLDLNESLRIVEHSISLRNQINNTNTPQPGQINDWNNSQGINFFYDTGLKTVNFFKKLFAKNTIDWPKDILLNEQVLPTDQDIVDRGIIQYQNLLGQLSVRMLNMLNIDTDTKDALLSVYIGTRPEVSKIFNGGFYKNLTDDEKTLFENAISETSLGNIVIIPHKNSIFTSVVNLDAAEKVIKQNKKEFLEAQENPKQWIVNNPESWDSTSTSKNSDLQISRFGLISGLSPSSIVQFILANNLSNKIFLTYNEIKPELARIIGEDSKILVDFKLKELPSGISLTNDEKNKLLLVLNKIKNQANLSDLEISAWVSQFRIESPGLYQTGYSSNDLEYASNINKIYDYARFNIITPLTFTNTPQSGQINAWNNSEGINFFYDTGVKIIDFFKNLFQKPTTPVSNPITPQETNIMKPVEELLLSYGDNSVKVIGISLNNVKLSTRTEIILKNGYLVTINSSLNYSSSTPLTLVITNPNGQEVTTATFKSLGGFNGDTNLIDSSGKIIAQARGRNIPMAIAQSLTGLQEIEINNSFVDSSRFNSWVEQQTSTLDFTNTPQSGQINAWNNSEGINFFYNLFFKTKVTTQVATEILNISDITNSNCWGSLFISPVYAVGSANGNGCNIKNFNLNQSWQTFSSPEFSTAIKKVWSVSGSKASAGVNLAQITLAQLFPQIPPCPSENMEKYQRHRNIVGIINRVGLSIIAQQDHIDLPVEIHLDDNCKDTTMQNLPIIPPNPPIVLPDSYSAQYLNNFIATNFDTLPIISEEVYQSYLNKSCPVKDSSYSLGSWRVNDQRCSIACTKSGESQGSCSNIKVVPSNEIICKDNSVIEASTNKVIENCSSCVNGACIINVSAGKSIPCSVPNKINPSSSSGQSFVFCNPQTKTWQPYAQGTEIEFTNSCPNIYRELLLADMISVQNNLIAKTGKLNISCNERGSDDDIFKEGTLNYNTTLSGIYNFSNLILTCDPTSLSAGGKKACVRPEVDGTNVLVHELSHMWVESLWQEGYNVTEAFSEVTGCKSDGSGTTVFKPGMAPVKQWGLQNCNEALATEFDTYTDPKESCKMKQNRPQEYLWLNTSELSPFKDSWNCGKI